jgi:hypothetical protein
MKRLLTALAFITLPAFAAEPTICDNVLINGELNGNATGWTQTGKQG